MHRQTNFVGEVDMLVGLGDGTQHPAPYDMAAAPYNYSDMTGFNNRIVNPGLQPLKGYWSVINDSGNAGQLWNKVSWHDSATNGCSVEVYVRASDDRTGLGTETLVQATNGAFFPSIRGQFIEVRLAIVRDSAAKQPMLYNLTLYGVSSGFSGDYFLDDARAYETQDATFLPNLNGASPLTYQCYRMYAWETNWVAVPEGTNSSLTITNVDSWVDWTIAGVLVTNGNAETLWLGPAFLEVVPLTSFLPRSGSAGMATQYPATITVFNQPQNLDKVIVTLWGITHTRSADLNILLQSPSGRSVILMSSVGGTSGVSNASLRFAQGAAQPLQAAAPPSGQTSLFGPSNYGQCTPQVPFALPAGPYSASLDDLRGENPNGPWKLYIYDSVSPGGVGQLTGSWSLDLEFQ